MNPLNKYYVSELYTLEPSEVEFSEDYVNFNPRHNEDTYEAVKSLIATIGQQKPILMLDGKCIDGRHRTLIASELGVKVMCVDVATNVESKELILLANLDSMGSRDYTPSQKAINAYKLVQNYGYKQKEAAILCGTKANTVGYVKALIKYGYSDVIDILERGGKVKLQGMETTSTSLEYLSKIGKVLFEKGKVTEDLSERIRFKPDSFIKTENGKAWFYGIVDRHQIPEGNVELRQVLSEYANYRFKLAEENS